MVHELPTPSVTLDLHIVQSLVTTQLNDLDMVSQDLGCCPICCSSCYALRELLRAGKLDELVMPIYRTDSVAYWDAEKNTIRADWLQHAWRMRDCCGDD